jgi:LPXTG-motif cell wall-anchored protein
MLFTFLDVPADDGSFISRNSNLLLAVIAVLALTGLVGIFIWQRKKRKTPE